MTEANLTDDGTTTITQDPAVEVDATPPPIGDNSQPPTTTNDEAIEAGGDVTATAFVVEEWMYAAIEALVFASTDPLPPSKIREVLVAELENMEGREGMPLPSHGDVKRACRTLLERYNTPERSVGLGFRLVDIDGGLCFRTVAATARYIRRMQQGKPQRLSRAALETLSVIAYRQPATKPQIEEVRGVDCGGALKALLDKKLVRVIGKAEEIGRPLLYGTTKTFLEFFNLSSLSELPTLKQLHELEHGTGEAPPEPRVEPAMVMDLFNPERLGLVSDATEKESAEALDDLEAALTTAKSVAKKASTVVWGVEVEDDDKAADKTNEPANDG